MSRITPNMSVECLDTYSDKDAASIGALHRHLNSRFTGNPVPEQILREIIESPHHDQIVAREANDTIIGTATVSIVFGSAIGRHAWLEDFVVSPDYQGQGVGDLLWGSIVSWCSNNRAEVLKFTSNSTRIAAHRFYLKRGATIRDTNYFTKIIPK